MIEEEKFVSATEWTTILPLHELVTSGYKKSLFFRVGFFVSKKKNFHSVANNLITTSMNPDTS